MALPPETVKFRIGGVDIDVPALSFADLEETRASMQALDAGLYWVDYAGHVIAIVAHQLANPGPAARRDLTAEVLKRMCTGGEAAQLAGQMNGLLRASGFPIPETPVAPPAADLGTGTSTSSAPSLPSETSAADILAS
jgi:hypothetical protein